MGGKIYKAFVRMLYGGVGGGARVSDAYGWKKC